MSSKPVRPSEARAGLADAERGRRKVIEEIGMPGWYWWGLALGWIGVGVVVDLDRPWLGGLATFLFGAGHAVAFQRVRSARRRTSRVSVRPVEEMRNISLYLVVSLLLLAAVTIVAAIVAAADGARHPVTMASVLVATCILLGGPATMMRLQRGILRQGPP